MRPAMTEAKDRTAKNESPGRRRRNPAGGVALTTRLTRHGPKMRLTCAPSWGIGTQLSSSRARLLDDER
jgi:hypothetical protein